MMNEKPKVTVIILNFNGRHYLGNLLDKAINSVLNQSYKNLEVIFADNGSSDDSIEYVSNKYANKVKVIDLGKNYGFCLGNNIASRHASHNSKYLLFMNPDAILNLDYVTKLVHAMELDGSIGMAQGLQISLDGVAHWIGGFIDNYGRSVEVDVKPVIGSLNKPIEVLWVSGSAMLIRKELFERLKGFPASFFMYYDEIDICTRALFEGYKAVCIPDAIYYHKRGMVQSNGINWLSWYFENRNRWITTIRYLPLFHLLKSLLVALPLELLVNIAKSIKANKIRTRLYLKIIIILSKNFHRELVVRGRYRRKIEALRKFILHIPLMKWEYSSRVALTKALTKIAEQLSRKTLYEDQR